MLINGSIQAVTGRFSAIGEVASLWLSAVSGSLPGQSLAEFTRFIAHEYIESRLIENGIDFRSFDPEYYNERLECFLATPNEFGAHDLSPLGDSTRSPFSHYERVLGRSPDQIPLEGQLTQPSELTTSSLEAIVISILSLI